MLDAHCLCMLDADCLCTFIAVPICLQARCILLFYVNTQPTCVKAGKQ